jgi:hypothetical protein
MVAGCHDDGGWELTVVCSSPATSSDIDSPWRRPQPTPDCRARKRLVSVILVRTLSDLVKLPGGVFRMGSEQFYPDEGRFMRSMLSLLRSSSIPSLMHSFRSSFPRPVT